MCGGDFREDKLRHGVGKPRFRCPGEPNVTTGARKFVGENRAA